MIELGGIEEVVTENGGVWLRCGVGWPRGPKLKMSNILRFLALFEEFKTDVISHF